MSRVLASSVVIFATKSLSFSQYACMILNGLGDEGTGCKVGAHM